MENIAHTLTGLAIAEAGFSERLGRRRALVLGAVASNAADLDVVEFVLRSPEAFHLDPRVPSHGLLTFALVAPLLGWVASRVGRHGALRLHVLLALAAWGAHLALDLVSPYGARILAPFDVVRVGIPWLYLIDPFVWVILTLPFWVPRLLPLALARANAIALLLLGAYVGLCGIFSGLAVAETARVCAAAGVEPSRIQAFPGAFLPVLWSGVATQGDLQFQRRVALVGPESDAPFARVATGNATHPAVKAVYATETGRRFRDAFASAPVAEVTCTATGYTVALTDLAFTDPWTGTPGFAWLSDVARGAGGETDRTAAFTVTSHRFVSAWTSDTHPVGDCLQWRTDTRVR